MMDDGTVIMLLIWACQILATIMNPEYIGVILMITAVCHILNGGVKLREESDGV